MTKCWRSIVVSLAFVGLCLFVSNCAAPRSSFAAEGVEKWIATSTTATSITGNITFTPTKIQFQNGQSLALTTVGRVADFKAEGEKVAAMVYRVTPPADPVLKNGNRLCGGAGHGQPVTFVVTWSPEPLPGDKPPRSMAAFSGKDAPHSDEGVCGIYNYELDK
jgi:hypothetical protein